MLKIPNDLMIALRQAPRVFSLALLASLVADAHALGTATAVDIPGALILDARVAAEHVNKITVGPTGNPPFTPGTEVVKLQTTQPFVAIRSYYSPYEVGKSGQAGGWISPIAETRGLSRAALLDRLALPINPDGTRNNTFALVLVPSGVKLWSGPAGAITDSVTPPLGSHWGYGGGIQYYVGRNAGDVAGFQVPLRNYVLAAPIGDTDLLAYKLRLSGNARRVGQNLDGLTVQAYSDLDRVLTALDMINLSPNTSDTDLARAIGQLGAERFGALGRAGLHQSRLLMDQLSSASLDEKSATWVTVQGTHAKQSSAVDRTGFLLDTTLLLAGAETRFAEHGKIGVAAGHLASNLDWSQRAAGNGDMKSTYLGSYASYEVGAVRATGQVFVGYSRMQTRRNISIANAGLWPDYSSAINRRASGSSKAMTQGARLELAHQGAVGPVKLSPFIGLEYQRFARDAFSESGADSLNLRVADKTHAESRLRLGIVSEVALGSAQAMDWSLPGRLLRAPRLSASGASLSAGFVGQDSTFSETTWRAPKTLNQVGLGLLGRGRNANFAVNYHYERNSGFSATTWMLSAGRRF